MFGPADLAKRRNSRRCAILQAALISSVQLGISILSHSQLIRCACPRSFHLFGQLVSAFLKGALKYAKIFTEWKCGSKRDVQGGANGFCWPVEKLSPLCWRARSARWHLHVPGPAHPPLSFFSRFCLTSSPMAL